MPVSEQLSREVFNLPLHPYLSEPDQERLVDVILRAI